MTTLRDIAARAGVSTCTVSKILAGGSDERRYSDGCRARVRAAAEALGFAPNHAARSLRTGATGILALAIDWTPMGAGSGFEAALIAACEAAARRRGLHLLVVGARPGGSAARAALELVGRRQSDGLVIPGGNVARDDLPALRAAGAAFIGQVPSRCVGAELDDGAGIAAAVAHLARLGHRRLAWIEPAGSQRAALRRAAFAAACRALALDARELLLPAYPRSGDEAQVAHARDTLLARRDQLADRTGFVCYHDLIALGAYAALGELGRRVPRDASVIGFDNVHAATALPALTTVDHELDALAEAAIAAWREGDTAPRQVATRLVERASTGRAPDSRRPTRKESP